MRKFNLLILTGAVAIAPVLFAGCNDRDSAKEDNKAAETGNTSTTVNTKPHDVAKQQNEIDPKDKNVPAGVKDKYIRDRKIVGAGKTSDTAGTADATKKTDSK